MTGNYSKLQIKLLSASGQLLNCVNCFAGQVAVLRASQVSELLPYQRALSGRSGPERFSIELDGEIYNAGEHNLIGFGEQFLATDGNPVDFLTVSGVPENIVETLAVTYGLERAFHAKCHMLSKCEERRLRILAACYSQNRIMVLNNPFDPISYEWRERFAELILQCARNQKQIIVVPSLSYRPECWIDNEVVARVQVGENLQKTVGFGSGGSEVNDIVSQVRQLFQNEQAAREFLKNIGREPASQDGSAGDAAGVAGQGPAETQKSLPRRTSDETASVAASVNLVQGSPQGKAPAADRRNLRELLTPQFLTSLAGRISDFVSLRSAGVAGVALVLLIAYALPSGKDAGEIVADTGPAEIEMAKVTDPAAEPPADPASADNSDPAAEGDLPAEVVPVGADILPPAGVSLLSVYPEDVRQAIMNTFEGRLLPAALRSGMRPDSPEPGTRSVRQGGKNAVSTQDAADFLKQLQFAGGKPGDPEPSAGSGSSLSPAQIIEENHPVDESNESLSEQEKREQIRNKFLEAIQKAAERRS